MTQKELERLKELNKKLRQLDERKKELQSLAESTTRYLDGLPRGSEHRSKVEESVIRLHQLLAEYERNDLERIELRSKLAVELFHLPPEQSKVLTLRYLGGRSYEAIGNEMSIPMRKVFYLHRTGLKMLFGVNTIKDD